jgi:hypothetical protein
MLGVEAQALPHGRRQKARGGIITIWAFILMTPRWTAMAADVWRLTQ